MLREDTNTPRPDESISTGRRTAASLMGLTVVSGLLPLAGCASSGHTTSPVVGAGSRRSTNELLARWGRNGTEVNRPLHTPSDTTAHRLGSPSPGSIASPANLETRAAWARGNPDFSDMTRMGRVERITIHHDGMDVFTSTSRDASMRRIENIRSAHRNRRWADIGYHYAVDPAGRVWEGRPSDWQGAHVKYHNEQNLGILVMGNYEEQRPTERQLAAVKQLLQSRCDAYGVPSNRVYTHRELRPTACPGRYLQPRIEAIRATLV